MEGACRMCRECMEGVWRVHSRWAEGMWKVFRESIESAWRVDFMLIRLLNAYGLIGCGVYP